MEIEDLAERLAAAEREIAALRAALAKAHGEAMYAGLVAPMAWTACVTAGVLSAGTARDALDGALLRLEAADGSFPGSKDALSYARARMEHLLGRLPPAHP